MDIKVKINPRHSANYYLDVNFEGINIENAKEVFGKFAKDLDKPVQIMLSSGETERIAILKAADFVCKRKCYEVEAQEQDYIGGKGEDSITFEADDCDDMAMELKSLFTNQDEKSFDTYIRHKVGL